MTHVAEQIGDFAGFRRIEAEWHTAFHASTTSCPTLHPAWSFGLLTRFASTDRFRILIVRETGRIALIFPYVLHPARFGLKIECACEISPVLCSEPNSEIFTICFNALRGWHGQHDLRMQHAQLDLPEVGGFVSAARNCYAAWDIRRVDSNVIVDLDDGRPGIRGRLSENSRQVLSRANSRLAAIGSNHEFAIFSNPDEMATAFSDVLAIDALSWKYRRGGAMARSGNEHSQYVGSFLKFAQSGFARIFVSKINGEPCAFVLAIVIRDRASLAVWTYADRFVSLSPGWTIMEQVLMALCDEGVREVDFWGRPDRFKSAWSNRVIERSSLEFYSRPFVAAASRMLRRLMGPLFTFAHGHAERYRLRKDRPAPVDRLIEPVRGALHRYGLKRKCERARIAANPVLPPSDLICRPLVPRDKLSIPQLVFAEEADWRVFVRGDKIVADMKVTMLNRQSLHLAGMWVSEVGGPTQSELAAALLRAFPHTRWIYEDRSQTLANPNGGIVAALNAGAGK